MSDSPDSPPRISALRQPDAGAGPSTPDVEDEVTIVIKTLLRPRSLRRSIRSIRKRFSRIRILVADDSGHDTLEDVDSVTAYYHLPRDSGASFGRNFLLSKVETPYVMVVDDDTLFDEETRLREAWQVLKDTPQLDLVAGHYRPARWWGRFEVDVERGTLRQVFGRPREILAGFPIYDFVPQFYVARSDRVRAVGWDDELKTLDHLQFFWRARGQLTATVLPYFSAFNTSERNPEYDAFRWQRVPHFRRLQLRKLGLRRIEDVRESMPASTAAGSKDENGASPALHASALDLPSGSRPTPSRTLVIGLGTGRCGTLSLTEVLRRAFDDAPISHERPPLPTWDAEPARIRRHLDRLADGGGRIFGDIAFYYLPHVETIRAWSEERGIRARFVCLRRDREQTIRSYVGKVRPYRANHWMRHDGERWAHVPEWDACYPKFDHCRDLEEALGAYWDHYRRESERLAELHPEAFRVFATEALNDRRELNHLVQFVAPTGLLTEAKVGVRLNTAETTHRLAARRQTAAGLPIWYLNLDRACRRRRNMENRLRALGVRTWTRLPAVDGQELTDVEQGRIGSTAFVNHLGPATPAADLGALLSHLRAAERLLETPNLDRVCILEDDMAFEDFDAWPGYRLSDLLAAAPPEWHILQLQTCNTNVLHWLALERRRRAFVPRADIDRVSKVWGAGAYLLSRRGAEALMKRHRPAGRFELGGVPFLSVERLLYDIAHVYVATEAFFVPDGEPSQIAAHHDAIDRGAAELTRALGSATAAQPGAGSPGPSDELVVTLCTPGRPANSSRLEAILADHGVPAPRRVFLRAVRGEQLTFEPSPDGLGRLGHAWGLPFLDRTRGPARPTELARVLSFLEALFLLDRGDHAEALILEPGFDAGALAVLLDRRHGRRIDRYLPTDDRPGAVRLRRPQIRELLARTWKDDRFLIEGDRASLPDLLRLTAGATTRGPSKVLQP